MSRSPPGLQGPRRWRFPARPGPCLGRWLPGLPAPVRPTQSRTTQVALPTPAVGNLGAEHWERSLHPAWVRGCTAVCADTWVWRGQEEGQEETNDHQISVHSAGKKNQWLPYSHPCCTHIPHSLSDLIGKHLHLARPGLTLRL